MHLSRDLEIAFGRRRSLFPKGYYVYVGSAFGSGGLESRLARHCSSQKKFHWHIDYFLEKASIISIVTAAEKKELEHELAEMFLRSRKFKSAVDRFGSSDCGCLTHLFYTTRKPDTKSVTRMIRKIRTGIVTACVDVNN